MTRIALTVDGIAQTEPDAEHCVELVAEENAPVDVNQVISAHADQLRLIVEVSDHPTDVLSHVRQRDGVAHEMSSDAQLDATLNRLAVGQRAIVVIDSAANDRDGISQRLADKGFRVVDAVPLQRSGESASDTPSHDGNPSDAADMARVLVVERLAEPIPSGDTSDVGGSGDLSASVESVTADVASNADDAEAVRLAAKERVAALEQRLVRQRNTIIQQRDNLDTLRTSVRYQLGTMAVGAVRHPLRAFVDVPAGLAEIVRKRRSRHEQRHEPKRIVQVALPATRPDRAMTTLTMTVPRRMHVPRRLDSLGLAGYEAPALACYLAAIEAAGPGAVFDIGANIGIYAALASALFDREVRAFEPTPELAAEARKFAVENGLAYRIEQIALGASSGSATLYLSDSTDSSNSLAKGFRKSSQQIEVPVETLDGYIARSGVKPAVMKVDTETTEPEILAGAAEYITTHRPWILCEVLYRRGEPRLMEVLKPFGYHWYLITDDAPYQETDTIVGDPTHENLMWLFAPERPGEAFWARVREISKAIAECTPGSAEASPGVR